MLFVEITDGGSSGGELTIEPQEVTAPEMARLLIEQGSDPEFFRLNEDGSPYTYIDEEDNCSC